jgi:hypothetical protein
MLLSPTQKTKQKQRMSLLCQNAWQEPLFFQLVASILVKNEEYSQRWQIRQWVPLKIACDKKYDSAAEAVQHICETLSDDITLNEEEPSLCAELSYYGRTSNWSTLMQEWILR